MKPEWEERVIGRQHDTHHRRRVQRLMNLCAGGWIVEFEPRKHSGEQNSTRGERRRAKLGRA